MIMVWTQVYLKRHFKCKLSYFLLTYIVFILQGKTKRQIFDLSLFIFLNETTCIFFTTLFSHCIVLTDLKPGA